MADRGFGSYALFAYLGARTANFIVRIKEKTYAGYHQLSTDSILSPDSQPVKS
jgi:hypothetical protein